MVEEIGVSKHKAENNVTRDYFSSRYNCYGIATCCFSGAKEQFDTSRGDLCGNMVLINLPEVATDLEDACKMQF